MGVKDFIEFKSELKFLITLSIFIITIIYFFFLQQRPSEANNVAFGYAFFVILLIFIYIVSIINEERIKKIHSRYFKHQKRSLVVIMSLLLSWVILLGNIDRLSTFFVAIGNACPIINPYYIMSILTIMLTILTFFISPLLTLFFVAWPELYVKTIKNFGSKRKRKKK